MTCKSPIWPMLVMLGIVYLTIIAIARSAVISYLLLTWTIEHPVWASIFLPLLSLVGASEYCWLNWIYAIAR